MYTLPFVIETKSLFYLCFQLNTLMTDINAFISQLMLILMNLIFFSQIRMQPISFFKRISPCVWLFDLVL